MQYETIPVGPLQVNCSILFDPSTRDTAIIDAGGDFDTIRQFIEQQRLNVRWILTTHGHFDHVGAIADLKKTYPAAEYALHKDDVPLANNAPKHAAIYGLRAVAPPAPDRYLAHGDVLQCGSITINVIATPGHSPGGVCFSIPAEATLFSGDTLFCESIGRTDLPGSDHNTLLTGIKSKLFTLAGNTTVIPGHGPDTTIEHEKKHNPFVGNRRL
ncbi:MBL fold metallo-hydrolase [Chrysiogenes arsenatis]|uniref:MBL fold metallo-hydrolase n=1 Tax=Chrysiogenes arsenatis TaxID=309797 RepID=UPI00048433CE|nr:MBL fold metallo-hydrolase [Chrysiogenes arsenatis]